MIKIFRVYYRDPEEIGGVQLWEYLDSFVDQESAENFIKLQTLKFPIRYFRLETIYYK